MPKLVAGAIFLLALITIGMRVLSIRRAGEIRLLLDSSTVSLQGSLRGSLQIAPNAEVLDATIRIHFVGRRRFSSPTETDDASGDFLHDTSDLFRSPVTEVSGVNLRPGNPWKIDFEARVPQDLPGPERRQTNAPKGPNSSAGTKPWVPAWFLEAEVSGTNLRAVEEIQLEGR